MKTLINWKVFLILWIAAILATLAVLPYTLELQSSAPLTSNLPMPLPALIALQMIQNAALLAIIIFGGMFFAKRVGLGIPILDSLTQGESVAAKVRAILPISIILGVLGALIILGLEFSYFQPAMLKELGDTAAALNLQTSPPAAWKGFLASFYGGIAEEIQLRLLVMSFFVWLGRFVSQTVEGKPTAAVVWSRASSDNGTARPAYTTCYCSRSGIERSTRYCIRLAVLETRTRIRDGLAFLCRHCLACIACIIGVRHGRRNQTMGISCSDDW